MRVLSLIFSTIAVIASLGVLIVAYIHNDGLVLILGCTSIICAGIGRICVDSDMEKRLKRYAHRW